MAVRRAARRPKVVRTDPLRFAHAAAYLDSADDAESAGAAEEDDAPTVHVDLVRPADLVALSVDAVGCELKAGGATPAYLRPLGDDARLVVRLGFQHLGEQAVYEGFTKPIPMAGDFYDDTGVKTEPQAVPPDGPNARPPIPAGARPARATRLVFAIPADERIEFSTAGILAAMGRLSLVVHPLAQPGDAPGRVDQLGPVIVLPGGLIGEVVADGIRLSGTSRARRRELGVPDEDTLAGTAYQARQLRRARALLQTRAATIAPRTRLPQTSGARPTLRIGGRDIAAAGLFGTGGLADRPPIGPGRPPRLPDRPVLSRPPETGETAIEAPYRLVISPSTEARWAHATDPVVADETPDDTEDTTPDETGTESTVPTGRTGPARVRHVELWHSRLAITATTPDGGTTADERAAGRRIVRAVWARDRETAGDEWRNPVDNLGHEPPYGDPGFRMSLDRADRHMLVRQSAETWVDGEGRAIAPVPVAARELWLSGLGAWLDLHGEWTTKPYSTASMSSILSWDHIAPLGRDQYVRVTYPGYLYPFGHRATLVKVTERKMKDVSPSVAGLYQRKFLVIGEPTRVHRDPRDLPYTEVTIGPLVTPVIDEPSGAPGDSQDSFFWPTVGGSRFLFSVSSLDHDGHRSVVPFPLIWVAEHYHGFSTVDTTYDNDPGRLAQVGGQRIAFAPSRPGEDTSAETVSISLRGSARLGDSTPRMSRAEIVLPAVQRLSGIAPVPVAYHPSYKSGGFANPGELWARVLVQGEQTPEHPTDATIALPQLRFGSGASSASDKGGGFLTPDLPIRALSRATGATGDVNGSVNAKQYLKGALPKLFGLVALEDLIDLVDSDLTKIPSVVSEVLDRIEGFVADLARAKAAVDQAVEEAQKVIERAAAKPADVQAAAAAALAKAEDLQTRITSLVDGLPAMFASLKHASEGDVAALLSVPLDQLRTALAEFRELGKSLPPYVRNLIDAVAGLLTEVLDGADLIQDLYRYLNGFASSFALLRFQYEWRPVMATAWPSAAAPILSMRKDSFLLGVYGQAGGAGPADVHVLAELRDFTLNLLPAAPLIKLPFEHLSFKSGTAGKPEVDVVLAGIEFCGVLGFVEEIKNAIPLDGFSDPPYLDVRPEGLTAGFSLVLPDIAIGVFAITNMSIGADVQVPFLGKVVTVGFNFCTRERPFTIAVAFLGGGGWCGIRISPDGLDVLEIGLEAGACLAVNFGVASGSVSAMIGIYIRLEGDGGSIAGYFRLRGEVDVLGLVSASLELYLELKYDTKSGKMTGRATITLTISVLGLSKSVKVSAERSFAGSNGDPSFREVMAAETGSSPAWTSYCLAFAEE